MHAEIYREPNRNCFGYTINFDKRFKQLLYLDQNNFTMTGFETAKEAYKQLIKRLNSLEERRLNIERYGKKDKENNNQPIFKCHSCGKELLPAKGMCGINGELFCYACLPENQDNR